MTEMTDETPWRIDPETLTLIGPAGPPEGYSARQFAAQVWPPCPVCGSMIEVTPLAMDNTLGPEPTFLPGPWRCPRGCRCEAPKPAGTDGDR